MKSSLIVIAGLIAVSVARPAAPASMDHLDVTRERARNRYMLMAETFMDASARSIYAVLLDYDDDAFERISSVYKESGYLPADADGTPLVYTRVEGCLLFFCRSMRRVERLEVDAPYFIRTTALPERSDFRHSRSEWILEPVDGGTKVTYRLEIEPDFGLPPFIGPWFLKRFLARGGIDAVEQIERLAQTLDSSGSATAAAVEVAVPDQSHL